LKNDHTDAQGKNGPIDSYDQLIATSRGINPEQAALRRVWFNELSLKDKESVLFEFEMMLKGLVSLGSPINYPGSSRTREPLSERLFNGELDVVRSVIANLVETGKKLLEGQERALVHYQYSESILSKKTELFQESRDRDDLNTPARSMALLVSALENLAVLTEGLLQSPHVSYASFLSVIKVAQREIHRSVFFNPLSALEFTEEYDRIHPQQILQLVRKTGNAPIQQVVATVFLSLFRLLKYIDYADALRQGKEAEITVVWAWLAALRNDARALTVFLKRNAPVGIAQGFGSLYENLSPGKVRENFETLSEEFQKLRPIIEQLVSVGNQLRLEQRMTFAQRLPAVGELKDQGQLNHTVGKAMDSLRVFLQNAVALIVSEMDSSVAISELLPGFMRPEVHSARLRRDIWMFQHILRAFLEKAQTTVRAADTWSEMASFHFVRSFMRYFRSLGYQLVRHSNYDQFDDFIFLLDRLKGGDVLQVQRFSNVVEACEDFQNFLQLSFESLDDQQELKGIPFDRKEAAITLKMFLSN
jgi:hypothetical protein